MSTIAYFDCPAGAAGDMILAAFLDLGLPLDHLQSELAKLAVDHYHLETKTTEKHHLAATQFIVHVDHQHHHRTLADIRNMIQQSALSEAVQQKAVAVFRKTGRGGRPHPWGSGGSGSFSRSWGRGFHCGYCGRVHCLGIF
jgi:uncharacterized protein (DUF111 family)